MTDEQKQKLSEMNKNKKWSEEDKAKLKGMIVVVNKEGHRMKISVEEYSNQKDDDQPKYVHFRTSEAKRRMEAKEVSSMRR